jgi:DNA polymerase-1
MLLQVHDELVLEVASEATEWARQLVPAVMQGVAELTVPLLADVGTGRSWAEAKG